MFKPSFRFVSLPVEGVTTGVFSGAKVPGGTLVLYRGGGSSCMAFIPAQAIVVSRPEPEPEPEPQSVWPKPGRVFKGLLTKAGTVHATDADNQTACGTPARKAWQKTMGPESIINCQSCLAKLGLD